MTQQTFYIAPGTGIVSTRSDWTKDATQVLFKCGAVRQSHEDRAIPEFLIFRTSWLAGEAKLASHSGINGDALNHNCLTVDNKAQTWTEDQSKIVSQEDTPAYTYLKGDAAASYAGQLTAYTRELLYVKPKFLLVRDLYTPLLSTSKVVWHLHSLVPPGVDPTSLTTGPAFRAGALFGMAIRPWDNPFSFVNVQNDPLDAKSYRTDLLGDSSNEIIVALEAGAPTQSARTLGDVVNSGGVKGIVAGNTFAAWLTGPGPWSYTSPVSGPHILVGLKPNTLYTVSAPSGGATVTSSAAGVLSWSSLTSAGTPITITEGQPPPPPPVATPVVTGKKYAYTMNNGVITLSEVGS